MSLLEQLKNLSQDELIQRIVQYKEDLEEAEEFRASSSELEKMLEVELEAAKKEAKEKDRRLQLAELELTRLQERSLYDKKEAARIEEVLRNELKTVKEERDKGRAQIRFLEQKNDDLERSERNNHQEMTDLMLKLNNAVERTTLLENEVAEKQAANEEMYRLKEELKERPRLVVEPLRIDKSDETPDEPTPEKDRPEMMDVTYIESAAKPVNPEASGNTEQKSFVSSVNRIIRDLMAKVEVLEGVMSRQKKSPRT